MKVLYAIQGTGNGHISRAKEIIPILRRYCEVDILLSGYDSEIQLPFGVKYKLKGLSFIFGNKGGINYWRSYRESNLLRLKKEIKNLPLEYYDFVINDFEPISAWAAKQKGIPCVALSHQCAVIHPLSPKPDQKDFIGKKILHNYAPYDLCYGFHFQSYASNIFGPVIREDIRVLLPTEKKHITVYLPSYAQDFLIEYFKKIKGMKFHIFSKRATESRKEGNIRIKPISEERFLKSLASCSGVICGAGFELPAEALYLKKKLIAIPMKGQFEQQCNAESLKQMGVKVFKKLDEGKIPKIEKWIKEDQKIDFDCPYELPKIIEMIFADVVSLYFKDKA